MYDEQQKYFPPKFLKKDFNCPHCGVKTVQHWDVVTDPYRDKMGFPVPLEVDGCTIYQLRCSYCSKCSLWSLLSHNDAIMIYPKTFPPEHRLDTEAGEKVINIYKEAIAVSSESPRAAAALLRLCMELLCQKLLEGEDKGDLSEMMDTLATKERFPEEVKEAMKEVRLMGNKAVHEAGLIALEDEPSVVNCLFSLVKYVIDETIVKQRRAKENIQKIKDARSRS